MAPGGEATNSDAVGVDVIMVRTAADEADGTMHVFDHFGNRKLGLASMNDRKNRVASLQKFIEETLIDRLV